MTIGAGASAKKVARNLENNWLSTGLSSELNNEVGDYLVRLPRGVFNHNQHCLYVSVLSLFSLSPFWLMMYETLILLQP